MLSTELSVPEVPKSQDTRFGGPEIVGRKQQIQSAEYEVYIEFGEEIIV